MPLVLHRTIMRDTQVGLWEITEDVHTLQSKLQLDDAELAHLDSIKVAKKKLQWLASRCVIRYMLAMPDFVEGSIVFGVVCKVRQGRRFTPLRRLAEPVQ